MTAMIATVFHECLFTTIDRACCPNLLLSALSDMRRMIAVASDRGSLAVTKMPACPMMVLRPIPPVAMIGFAQVMASNTTFGNPSPRLDGTTQRDC